MKYKYNGNSSEHWIAVKRLTMSMSVNFEKDNIYEAELYNDKFHINVSDGFIVEIPFETFIENFNPYEENKYLHMKRFTKKELDFLNCFIGNKNHKIVEIHEPDNKTIDIYYTCEVGDWSHINYSI